jgi:uncharacterized membrane protein
MVATYGAAYLASLVIFIGIDAAWLAAMVSRFYRPHLGDLLRERPRLAPAGAFYLAYPAGVVALAVAPALASGRWTGALVHGAVLGALCYGTYNLTNRATLRRWPVALALVDTGWGALVTAATAAAGCWIGRALTVA